MKNLFFILLSFLSISINAQNITSINTLTNSSVKFDNKTFIDDYQDNVDRLLGSFKLNEKSPLNAKIFDIADKQVYSFLESSTGWKTNGEMMANMYYPKFFVNGHQTSFCFVLYDSESRLLEGYSKVLKYNEILDYLTYHEMGHCLENYIKQTTGKKFSNNREDTELFADIFAMANLLYLKKDNQAEKVININEAADKKDYHYQPGRLLRALNILKSYNINETVGAPNVNKIVDLSKNVFYKLKQDELINPIFVATQETKKEVIQLESQKSSLSGWTIKRIN